MTGGRRQAGSDDEYYESYYKKRLAHEYLNRSHMRCLVTIPGRPVTQRN